MVRASFAHWAPYSFEDLASRSFEWLDDPGPGLQLTASMALAPVVASKTEANQVISPLLSAYAKQFARILDLIYELNLLKRIEFVTGSDLDIAWGRVYQLKRISGESDEHYRKRLQIYLLQLAGSGTKAAIENIISVIVEWPDSCRVDSYWPGYCRIYLTDSRARAKARSRLELINRILPETVAAGIDFRFYIPYHDVTAYMALRGPVRTPVEASQALIDKTLIELEAHIYLASKHSEEVQADMVLAIIPQSRIRAYMALRDRVDNEIEASEALSTRHDSEIEASILCMDRVDTPLTAYERLKGQNLSEIEADMVLQGRRYRPFEARMRLEEA